MESGPPVKPPWQLGPAAWQRGAAAAAAAAAPITFGPWVETFSPDLQLAKEKISPLEASKRWELIKKMVNPYEMVFTHEDPHFHPSISLLKPLSRSYFKLIEMLDVMQFFELLPKKNPKIRTAHVAEGPGGFIQAVLDVAERNRRLVSQATAMTLKPTDNFVPGWRRAAAFLHHHREVKLHYGVDGTGDVYQQGNQDSFVEAAAPGAHLFTADGGFDFSINYTVQERRVFHLLVCSATVGLRSLVTDGAFVLKLFDMSSESTQLLVLLMGRCFKEWILYKPALSRPCNSERYFLGRGFKGLQPKMLELLLQIQQSSLREEYPFGLASFAQDDERKYLEQHRAAMNENQLAALRRAEVYTAKPDEWYTSQIQSDFQASLRWCNRFRIPTQMVRPLAVSPAPLSPFLSPAAGPRHPRGECIFAQVAGPQSQLPDDDSRPLDPSGQAL